MAIELVGWAYDYGVNSVDLTSLYDGIGASPAQNDIVLVFLSAAMNSDVDFSTYKPSGYTVNADLYANDGLDSNLGVFYKIMGSTPDTSVSISSGLTKLQWLVYVFRGVNTTTPLDATTTTNTRIDSADGLSPSITTVTANAMVLSAYGTGDFNSLTAAPSGYTVETGGLSGYGRIGVGYKLKATAGLESPSAWDHSATSTLNSSCTATVALRPAGASSTGKIKVWNGSAWVAKPVKVWNGSSWVEKPVKYWNGTSWITTTY